MDETILLPSPNWFLPSVMAVSIDGWLIYGGPNKSLCVLEPQKADVGVIAGNEKYQAHVFYCGHSDKTVAVDISPEWLKKRSILTATLDGIVKQWVLETIDKRIKIKETHCHDVHKTETEDVVGVGYSDESIAISVGASNIVKWDLSSNVTKVYPNFMRSFKPTCMACSPHATLQVAVGTKQGVIFLLDLHGKGRILYKVRGQDDIVMNISWCPKYQMTVRKTFKENKSILASRLAAIRSEGERETNVLEESGIGKNLPDDSFDEPIVQEDDMFDIYKDHEPDEFGHKKYEPEDILVKVKKEKADDSDYLAECLKLKEEILKRKNQTEPTIESLVDALDKTHVEGAADGQTVHAEVESAQSQPESAQASTSSVKCVKIDAKTSHVYQHLLASVGKFGGVRIWSESGKLVGSCAIPAPPKNQKGNFVTSILWYKIDSLLIVDGRSQLVEINPTHIDSKNRLEWQIIHHLHKRGMYCIKTNAPRIQTESTELSDDWSVWSASQDRNIIRYCLKSRKALGVHATCGGSVYTVLACPYDAGKVAVSVGDGAVRVLESSTLAEDDRKLTPARVSSYWQNVQGKVLTIAWHPTREHLLAFATGESRVGLIDTSGKSEQSARVLNPALSQGVYALCWGEGMQLYASGGNKLVVYRAQLPNEGLSIQTVLNNGLAAVVAVLKRLLKCPSSADPEQLDITIEGQAWEICAVNWTPHGLLVGSVTGAVALLTHRQPHTLIAAAFIFNKMIHSIEWHPQQTSSSSEESPYKNLIAVTSLDRDCVIIILEYGTDKKDGTRQLTTWKTLSGHTKPVLQAAWNPHRDGLLLTSSQDASVRVWDVSTGSCISIFGGHSHVSLGVCWMSQPQLPHHVMSGGGEFCLRLWDIYQHKPEDYAGKLPQVVITKRRPRKKGKKEKVDPVPDASSSAEEQENVAIKLELTNKAARPPKKFLLPIMFKQINDPCKLQAPRKMLQMILQKTDATRERGDGKPNTVNEQGDSTTDKAQGDAPTTVDEKGDSVEDTHPQETVDTKARAQGMAENTEVAVQEGANILAVKEIDLDFLKVFGSIREVNEFLDLEMASHLKAYYNPEACIMLSIFRGHIDTMIQFASERDMLCPFLLSMAPCVSFKYWKDATQLYLAQIDRLVARGEEHKLYDNKHYGGSTYRKAAILLSMHDVMGAVAALCEGKLFKEAYILCRIRYMDSVAEEILGKWADDLTLSGQLTVSAVCYMAMGNLSEAAQVLAKSHDQEYLRLAADIAKVAGRTTFADHVQKKANQSKSQATSEKTEELLKELPSKIELLMKENKDHTSDNLESDTLNGETLKSDKLNGHTETNE